MANFYKSGEDMTAYVSITLLFLSHCQCYHNLLSLFLSLSLSLSHTHTHIHVRITSVSGIEKKFSQTVHGSYDMYKLPKHVKHVHHDGGMAMAPLMCPSYFGSTNIT